MSFMRLAAALIVATSGPACMAPSSPSGSTRPNIVIVMSDDQGYGDFGFTGNTVLETPHLDALAAECPQVERFYVSPVCSPTRACLMTGRYNYRTRVVDTWIGRSMMEPDEVTLAEALRPAGYRTGIFGKWHLGDCYPLRPQDQGFDEVLVHRGGGLAQPSEPPGNASRYTDALLVRNGTVVETSGFCTDVYFDAALDFIDESVVRDQPFFAYVATNAPHGPFHDVPPELYEKYKSMDLSGVLDGADPDKIARIFAMVENIDSNVGRLLAHLEARDLARDTIFVFLNDNGPVGGRYNAGLRGHKSGVHEGGIRTPLLVRWPGRLSPETRVTKPAAHIDLLPTLLEAADVAPPADLHLDGRSLMPLLEGREVPWPERQIVLQTHRGNEPIAEHHFAVIESRWKLAHASGFGATPQLDTPFELFDLEVDPGETRDLAAAHPEIVARLRSAYADWFADVSNTRPANFEPPRIVIGSEHEAVTVLTRQDWRRDRGGGWGSEGSWWLHADAPIDCEVTLEFVDARAIDTALLHIGEATTRVELGGESKSVFELGRMRFPSGPIQLRVELESDGERSGPYHVQLRRVAGS